jgi:putative ABC transport system permease protein
MLSVLIEGMALALPGALLGAAIAWAFYNGHLVSPGGLIFKLTVTPHVVWVAVAWALVIGLLGASLPALRAVRVPVATALRDT